MPANTAEGWPYLLDEDHPLEYPAHSQAMANLLDQRWDTYQTSGLLVPTTPWSDSGGGLRCTRGAGLVIIEGSMKPTSSQSMAVGTYVNLATIPVGFRPVGSVFAATVVYNGTAMAPLGFAEFKPDGVLRAMALTATTVATTGTVSFLAAYRGA